MSITFAKPIMSLGGIDPLGLFRINHSSFIAHLPTITSGFPSRLAVRICAMNLRSPLCTNPFALADLPSDITTADSCLRTRDHGSGGRGTIFFKNRFRAVDLRFLCVI